MTPCLLITTPYGTLTSAARRRPRRKASGSVIRRAVPAALLLAALLFLAASNYDYAPPSGSDPSPSPAARIPDRAASLPQGTPGVRPADPIVRIVAHFASGAEVVLYDAQTTPEPMLQPTAPPTNTPRATLTPTPSPTRALTATSKASPTPTPAPTEPPQPSPTQQTTPPPALPTSSPPPGACQGVVVNGAGLTLRANHALAADARRLLPVGESVTILSFYVYQDAVDEWAYVRTARGEHGWLAAYYYAPPRRMLQWDDAAEVCLPPNVEVQYHTNPLPTPAPVTFYDGFHTLAAEGASSLLAPQYIGRFRLVKCLDGGFALCQQAKAANPNVLTIYRSYQHDCPPVWVYTSPESWWAMIENELPSGADFYEVENECGPPIEYFSLWANFSIEMAKIIERERGAAMLAFSFGPGNPDIHEWRDLWPYLEWSKTRVAPNGFRHGVAVHSSAYAPPDVPLLPGSYINNPYIAGREQIVCAYAQANYGLSCDGVIFIETEMGWLDGYAGNKQAFTCEQQGKMYRETIRREIEIGIVTGFAIWNLGPVGIWSSAHACLPEMLL